MSAFCTDKTPGGDTDRELIVQFLKLRLKLRIPFSHGGGPLGGAGRAQWVYEQKADWRSRRACYDIGSCRKFW
jgi:hypothetical protein